MRDHSANVIHAASSAARVAVGVMCLLSVATPAIAHGDLLVEAVKNRDTVAVATLLEQSVDVNIPQPDGATALHWAAHWDDLALANRLIRAGAHANAVNDYGVTPLLLAGTDASAA